MEKKIVVVLGTTGMLGSMVYRYLSRVPGLAVIGTTRATFDAERFALGESGMLPPVGDYIINCIGIIKPFCKDNDPAGVRKAIAVNALFPHRLHDHAQTHGSRVIQIATDCVYSGAKGQYDEAAAHDPLDVYGKTKSLGEVRKSGFLNLRCSIIGPEVKTKISLLEWFLGHPDGAEVDGYDHHRWNGVTTLQFARLCEAIISADNVFDQLVEISNVHHFVPNSTVTKYELLSIFNRAFDRRIRIRRTAEKGGAIDRTIATRFGALDGLCAKGSMDDAVRELSEYIRAG